MSFDYLLSRVDLSDFDQDSIQDTRVMRERRIVRAAYMEANNAVLHAALLDARPLRDLYLLSLAALLLDVLKTVDTFRVEGVSERDIRLFVKCYGREVANLINKYDAEGLSPHDAFALLNPLDTEQ